MWPAAAVVWERGEWPRTHDTKQPTSGAVARDGGSRTSWRGHLGEVAAALGCRVASLAACAQSLRRPPQHSAPSPTREPDYNQRGWQGHCIVDKDPVEMQLPLYTLLLRCVSFVRPSAAGVKRLRGALAGWVGP